MKFDAIIARLLGGMSLVAAGIQARAEAVLDDRSCDGIAKRTAKA